MKRVARLLFWARDLISVFGFCEAVSFHPSQANSGIIQREICDARRKSYADETGGFDAKVKQKKKIVRGRDGWV